MASLTNRTALITGDARIADAPKMNTQHAVTKR